ncbi:hypothetical protein D5S19_06430 [Amycolatopsis panacis]|uniref:Uncharacterized protein n=1 Tax=Amycolatopsis panacis TaxID=2340917 RepID=A0A419I8S3_9PSEU|nr:hypothetical protein D5S19_06430 [Amycolatopsis panacis]
MTNMNPEISRFSDLVYIFDEYVRNPSEINFVLLENQNCAWIHRVVRLVSEEESRTWLQAAQDSVSTAFIRHPMAYAGDQEAAGGRAVRSYGWLGDQVDGVPGEPPLGTCDLLPR